ncbi:MAG: HAD family phosphatase [Propionicimonas sp.]|uniref:HAD family hydrolase n=1 Tax=Propionicimonas sp. TaxID=1955623 RepID=UPI002B20048E|nr:HAD family phosphatase [Propionicimonas sp.]MEA4944740.1 HAD family phosphatase [Propionicimonas sp.]MEA5054098.1 HAD family phosphatase [Propionicimonas sp.]MEA5118868.1 HAD family phosphatase [Propionicimonas sp.]
MAGAIVFDMDGTLTDTEAIWDTVRRGLAASEGLPWPDGATQAMMGMSTQEWSAHLVEAVGLTGTPEQAAQRTIDGMLQAYHQGIQLLPGAVDAIRRLGAHWPLGLASSSPRVLIEAGVEAMGVTGAFAVTLSTEELDGAGKPAPDVYLEAARRLGVEPRLAVAIEDAPNGIKSAHAAGLSVIAVPPHFHPPSAEVLALADVVVDTLDDIDVDLVQSLIERR